MTRDEVEQLARLDASEGERRTVPAHAEAWYEAEHQAESAWLERRRRAGLRRRGIHLMPWERA